MSNLLDVSKPLRSRASSIQRSLEATKNRSFDNVKHYCLAKITRTLDTKDEFSKVEKTGSIKRKAAKAVKQQYEEVKRNCFNPPRGVSQQNIYPTQN